MLIVARHDCGRYVADRRGDFVRREITEVILHFYCDRIYTVVPKHMDRRDCPQAVRYNHRAVRMCAIAPRDGGRMSIQCAGIAEGGHEVYCRPLPTREVGRSEDGGCQVSDLNFECDL